jgi:hypothetical protein
MAVDIISITALIISIIGAIGVFIKRTHLQHIVFCKCIESDCKNGSHENDNNNNNNNNQDLDLDIYDPSGQFVSAKQYLDTIIEKSITPKIKRKDIIEV